MPSFLRSTPTVIWLFLIGATVASWLLGNDFGVPGVSHSLATTLILVVAAIKLHLVGYHFMELRDAPWMLRSAFNFYCAGLLVTMLVLYRL
ncbi:MULTISPECIES: cytochrome C oxidase subunit IV family protein [unclassified Nocardioides]|uniref:cytochrome C oxidase subunit IV family protein n=1 Tax=unclassified Nocardioides TaxID=2615069 RepID=UPI000700C589|nr:MULTISPECIES: cytochrome C oxidase subunit IV family protein [unclassified Nocardioides]KRA31069.1 hypothetical protein ASD81_16400 [Nocardioides sp. Root614]KRA87689.1 hypothetical protein ASD84_16670 [Nocardioides sp. Root682]